MAHVSDTAGFSLLEALVALFLISVVVLAAAPMFMHAAQAIDAGADMGSVGSIAVDRAERLRQQIWRDLGAGGSLDADIDGYFDSTDPNFLIRWQITDNVTPSHSKTITVLAMARGTLPGPRRRVELTLIRGR